MRRDCIGLTQFISLAFLLFISLAAAGQKTPASQNLYSVNFISIGAGTDYKAEDRLLKYIKGFEKENKVSLDYKIEHWGKEGETKYILDLKDLPPTLQSKLKDSLLEMFKGNNLVQVGKNSNQ